VGLALDRAVVGEAFGWSNGTDGCVSCRLRSLKGIKGSVLALVVSLLLKRPFGKLTLESRP
jgi:hypothetical protein